MIILVYAQSIRTEFFNRFLYLNMNCICYACKYRYLFHVLWPGKPSLAGFKCCALKTTIVSRLVSGINISENNTWPKPRSRGWSLTCHEKNVYKNVTLEICLNVWINSLAQVPGINSSHCNQLIVCGSILVNNKKLYCVGNLWVCRFTQGMNGCLVVWEDKWASALFLDSFLRF